MTVATCEKRIVLAEVMGYCWGVRRALEIVQQAAQAGPIATVGDVIHNPQVVERLKVHGIEPVSSVSEARERGFRRVAITAHGAGPQRAAEARDAGLELIDTTCPLVTKVQRLAEKLVRQGYFLVVYGDAHHPEVRGVLGWAGTSRAVAAKHLEDLPWNGPRGVPGVVAPPRKVAVVSQTTKQTDEFLAFALGLANWVARHGGEIRIVNTICQPTWERQEALRALAREVDVLLAVGGKKSSNTARLAEVGRACGVPSYHIERPEEIDRAWLEGKRVVGVTAGASTPDEVVLAVVDHLAALGYQRPERLWRYEAPDLEDFAE
jgi:4-hydroxy-3-methylbut-2-enyl diphosphate reductase